MATNEAPSCPTSIRKKLFFTSTTRHLLNYYGALGAQKGVFWWFSAGFWHFMDFGIFPKNMSEFYRSWNFWKIQVSDFDWIMFSKSLESNPNPSPLPDTPKIEKNENSNFLQPPSLWILIWNFPRGWSGEGAKQLRKWCGNGAKQIAKMVRRRCNTQSRNWSREIATIWIRPPLRGPPKKEFPF